MSVLERLLSPDAQEQDIFGSGRWTQVADFGSARFMGTSSSAAGEAINESTVMALTAYFACMRNISEDSAKLPLPLYRRMSTGREMVRDHPAYKVLRSPNVTMSGYELRETLMQHAVAFCGGYAEIMRDAAGNPKEIWLLDPTRTVMKMDGTRVWYEYRDEDNVTTPIRFDNVIHIHGLGWDGMCGYSIATLFREVFGAALAAYKHGGSLWGNGAVIGGVMQHPGQLTDQGLRHLRESFEQRHGGSKNAGRWVIAEEGMTYTQLGIEPDKAQLIESHQFYVEDVARAFRMPLHKIQQLLRATYSNIEHQSIEYVTDCLMPWLVRLEAELDRKLLGSFDEDSDLYFRHNVNALLRGDSQARSDYYTKMIQIGVTPNEIRELEDMNGIGPEGDISYIALNLRPQTPEAREAAMKQPATPPPSDNLKTTPERQGGRPVNSRDYVDILAHILDPLMRKEANAITKAAAKFERADFIAHVAKFNLAHRMQLIDALEIPITSICRMLGNETAGQSLAWNCADAVIDGHSKMLQAAAYPEDIDRLAEMWLVETRAIAQRLFAQIVNAVELATGEKLCLTDAA